MPFTDLRADRPVIALLLRGFEKCLGDATAESCATVAGRSLQRDPVALDEDAKATLLFISRIPPVDADAAVVQVPHASVAGIRRVPVCDSAARQEIDIEGVACGD